MFYIRFTSSDNDQNHKITLDLADSKLTPNSFTSANSAFFSLRPLRETEQVSLAILLILQILPMTTFLVRYLIWMFYIRFTSSDNI